MSQDIYQGDAVLCFLRLFFFRLEAKSSSSIWKTGINAYSTLLKSRLLNYYFLGFKDRSQQTMKEPLGWHNCLCKGFYDHLSLYNLFKLNIDIFKCMRHGLKIWALSRVGLIIPFLEVRMRKQRLTVGRIEVYSNRLRVKPMGMEGGP